MKQTIYIPTKVEDELPEEDTFYLCKIGFNVIKQIELFKGIFINEEGNENIDDDTDIKDITPYKSSITEWFKPTEAYVFTPEELKQLLEEYTNTIVENAKVEYKKDLLTGEVDKESITSQLPKFLNEIGI
jgi:hypothetical protein